MELGFLRLMNVLLSILPERIARLDVAPPPTPIPTLPQADVAPPTGLYVAIGAGVLLVLCLLVAAIVLVAFFVIRAVKKNRAAKEQS